MVVELDKESQEAKWELINSEQAARLDHQEQSLSRIETKAGVIAAFSLAAGQFLATRHPFATTTSTLFGLIAFTSYLATAGCSIWVTRVARTAGMNAATLADDAKNPDLTRAQMLQQLIVSRAEVYEKRNRQNAGRARAWLISVGCLSAGLVSSVACIMLTT